MEIMTKLPCTCSMTSSLLTADLKGNMFGHSIYTPSFFVIAFKVVELLGRRWGGGGGIVLEPRRPGFDSQTLSYIWVDFVVGSHPLVSLVFPSRQKPTFPK